MQYFEDIEVGGKASFGRYDVTRDEVIAFAQKYDPQPFHLSDEAAAETHFGRLAASGWHTCAMTMKMLVDEWTQDGHFSLGGNAVDELRWTKPVYPGDVLSVEAEVIDKREPRSRPDMGFVTYQMTVFNQKDEPVMTMKVTNMQPRKTAGQ